MHTFVSALLHCVFATKARLPSITTDLQPRLWPYLGGIAREHGMKAMAIGEVEDHVHIAISLPATLALAKAMQLIKGNSSKWVHESFPAHRAFAWQEGYGAFSIGLSSVEDTVGYIQRQAEHHQKRTFREEFVMMIERHGMTWVERDLP